MVMFRGPITQIIILLAVGVATAEQPTFTPVPPSPFRFEAEFTKAEIYEGESVSCHFMLYALEDAVDVEVAKFPEFRGYWSENLALRQGPVPLQPDMTGPYRKTIIGTYALTPMVAKSGMSVEPMKLVVKNAFRQPGEPDGERTLISNVPPLIIRPLPPLPPGLPPDAFHGAVGTFNLSAEANIIPFQKDEPVAVRFTLQGEGNFQEINEIKLPLPPFVELLSKRASSYGSGQYVAKTFEMTLVAHTDQSFELPSVVFVFFNPRGGTYESHTLPALRFAPETRTLGGADVKHPHDEVGMPEARFTAYRPLEKSPFFWGTHAVLLFITAGTAMKELGRRRHRAFRDTRSFQRANLWQQAQDELKIGRMDGFLKLADELAFSLIAQEARVRPHGMTHAELLARAQGRVPEDRLRAARRLFQAHETFSYSGTKHLPESPDALSEALSHLAGSGSASFRRRKSS